MSSKKTKKSEDDARAATQILINTIPVAWKDIFLDNSAKELSHVFSQLRKYGPEFEELCPAPKNIFKAFQLVPPQDVKIVIIGQDPYHSPGVADGLCFSTQDEKIPHSLKNIYKTLKSNELVKETEHSCLQNWAIQGTLMINSALTTEESRPGHHAKMWIPWTKWLISYLSANYENLIFVLWGKHAQSFASEIDETYHYVYRWAHPSPAQTGHKNTRFINCDHFERIPDLYEYLHGVSFNWNVTSNTVIYTDGACHGNGKDNAKGGFGVYFQAGPLKHTNMYGPIRPTEYDGEFLKVTNNRSELTAICEALEYYHDRGCVGNLTLVTDSQICQKTITEWIDGWYSRNLIDKKKNPDLIWRLWGALVNIRHFQKIFGFYFKVIHVNSHLKKKGMKIPEKGTKKYKLYEGNFVVDDLADMGEKCENIVIRIKELRV